jgi:hypothetical protein
MALACAYEQRLALVANPPTHPGSRLAYGCTKQLALPVPPPIAGGQTGLPTGATNELCFKYLTMAKMASKRSWGECYNCTKKFTKEHLEVCPLKGIFLLELDSSEPTDHPDDTMILISLNVFIGIAATETMKLSVHLGSDTITALVDSGSTHSFISTVAIYHLHLDPLFHPSHQVIVTNGDRVASAGICHNVKFYIDSKEFVLDLFIIPLAGYEMVLSVQWLHTLRPIL